MQNDAQPIETAPKDGTEFLAWDGTRWFIARWSAFWEKWEIPWRGADKWDGYLDGLLLWQALPPAPTPALEPEVDVL